MKKIYYVLLSMLVTLLITVFLFKESTNDKDIDIISEISIEDIDIPSVNTSYVENSTLKSSNSNDASSIEISTEIKEEPIEVTETKELTETKEATKEEMKYSLEEAEDILGIEETYINEEYLSYIKDVCAEYHVCPELIVAMIEKESSGDKNATSYCNAQGLMQIVPKWHKERMKRLHITDLYDPYENILIGVDFVCELFEKYDDMYVVLMCYNEGEYGTAIERAEEGKFSDYAKSILKRSDELQKLHELVE